MLKKILPSGILSLIEERLNFEKLYEIRLRSNRPILINYGGSFYHLCEKGISKEFSKAAIFCDSKLIESVVFKAGEYSLYAINNQLKEGFITIGGGIRLGICGEIVEEGGEIKTIKNFSSLNIRIPHEVSGCALTAYKYIVASERIHNTLIVSPPGSGKTTFLRDLARNFSLALPVLNVLILDERSEIAACSNGKAQLDVGMYTDIMSNCSKNYGFLQGIRVMRPDVIITDELAGFEDVEAVRMAAFSGIKVVASAHARDIYDLVDKSGFEGVLKKQIFSRFVVLSDRRGPGTYEGIYDENLKTLYYSGG